MNDKAVAEAVAELHSAHRDCAIQLRVICLALHAGKVKPTELAAGETMLRRVAVAEAKLATAVQGKDT
jgi:hypothetical protein